MGNGFVAFLLAAGFSAWLYSKLMRSTGGNTKNAVIASTIAGVLIFVLALVILGFLPD